MCLLQLQTNTVSVHQLHLFITQVNTGNFIEVVNSSSDEGECDDDGNDDDQDDGNDQDIGIPFPLDNMCKYPTIVLDQHVVTE